MHELYTVLAKYYDSIYRRRAQEISREVAFLEEVFREDAKREVRDVLDLACGTGIPTVELANRGYNVVGIDLHEEMLEVARRKTDKVKFIQGNALEINFREEFDAVTMLFSSITYFNEEKLMILFRKVHEALRPGGVFIADFPQWFVVRNLGPFVWDEVHGEERLIITDWREVLPGVQKVRFKRLVQILRPNGEVRAFFVSDELNIYTPREIKLLGGEVFGEVRVYSDYERKLRENAKRFWAVMVKA
ncbi:SAM-dependent methyltransferase [Thermococcus chitonophagus]|nr:class I SAM-dependent methyltransferase [Thermococcus chitonophagus]ASJ17627.1 SAM-dependent methyltransferase [Thermococcus chitonophagus]